LFSAKNFNSCSSAIFTYTLLPINTASIALFHVLISVFAAFCLPALARHYSKFTAGTSNRALVALNPAMREKTDVAQDPALRDC
jgi:hypothetical protein